MADTDYASIAELKERISATNITDSLALQYLNQAAYTLDRVTRKPPPGKVAFTQTTETRYFDDDRRHTAYGIVEIDDLLSVTDVTRNGISAGDSTSGKYQLWPYNPGTGPYTQLRWMLNAPVSASANSGLTYRGVDPKAIAIAGTWGYCTTANRPPVVKEVTLQLATLYFQRLSISISDLIQAIGNPNMKELHAIMRMLDDAQLLRHRELVGA